MTELMEQKPTPSNIFLLGFMGSGKTHWAEKWAAANDLSYVDLDEIIELKEGLSIANIFEAKGENYFREIETVTLKACADLKNTIIACGGGTPCFNDNIKWMNQNGVTIFIKSTPQEILERVLREQKKRPLLKNLNHTELLFFIQQKLAEREPFYSQASITVQSSELTDDSLKELQLVTRV